MMLGEYCGRKSVVEGRVLRRKSVAKKECCEGRVLRRKSVEGRVLRRKSVVKEECGRKSVVKEECLEGGKKLGRRTRDLRGVLYAKGFGGFPCFPCRRFLQMSFCGGPCRGW